MGVLDGQTGHGDALLTAAAAHVDAGADALDVVAGVDGIALAEAVAMLRASFDVPVGVRCDDVEQVREALDAGAVLTRTSGPPNADYLDTVAVRDAALVITDPSGDLGRRASMCGFSDDQIVLEAGPDGAGGRALATALESLDRLVARGHPVSWTCAHVAPEHALPAIAWAVACGARVVSTRDVGPAARVARTFAAILEEDAS